MPASVAFADPVRTTTPSGVSNTKSLAWSPPNVADHRLRAGSWAPASRRASPSDAPCGGMSAAGLSTATRSNASSTRVGCGRGTPPARSGPRRAALSTNARNHCSLTNGETTRRARASAGDDGVSVRRCRARGGAVNRTAPAQLAEPRPDPRRGRRSRRGGVVDRSDRPCRAAGGRTSTRASWGASVVVAARRTGRTRAEQRVPRGVERQVAGGAQHPEHARRPTGCR